MSLIAGVGAFLFIAAVAIVLILFNDAELLVGSSDSSSYNSHLKTAYSIAVSAATLGFIGMSLPQGSKCPMPMY